MLTIEPCQYHRIFLEHLDCEDSEARNKFGGLWFECYSTSYKFSIEIIMEQMNLLMLEKYDSEDWNVINWKSLFTIFRLSVFRQNAQSYSNRPHPKLPGDSDVD